MYIWHRQMGTPSPNPGTAEPKALTTVQSKDQRVLHKRSIRIQHENLSNQKLHGTGVRSSISRSSK